MSDADRGEPLDMEVFVRELVEDLRAPVHVYSAKGELLRVQSFERGFELERYETDGSVLTLWFRHEDPEEVVRVVVHADRLASDVDAMPSWQGLAGSRAGDVANWAGAMLSEMLATKQAGVTEMEL